MDLKVKVRARATSGIADGGNLLPLADLLSVSNEKATAMGVERDAAVVVSELYELSIAATPAGFYDFTRAGGHNWRSYGSGDVDPLMQSTPAHAVARRDRSARRPDIAVEGTGALGQIIFGIAEGRKLGDNNLAD